MGGRKATGSAKRKKRSEDAPTQPESEETQAITSGSVRTTRGRGSRGGEKTTSSEIPRPVGTRSSGRNRIATGPEQKYANYEHSLSLAAAQKAQAGNAVPGTEPINPLAPPSPGRSKKRQKKPPATIQNAQVSYRAHFNSHNR